MKVGALHRVAILIGCASMVVTACCSATEDAVTETATTVRASDETVVEENEGPATQVFDQAEFEAEAVPAIESMFAFIAANPSVCTGEFESFNTPYPENDPEAVKELDKGIEERGEALMACLEDAGEPEIRENVSVLTVWGRIQADAGVGAGG